MSPSTQQTVIALIAFTLTLLILAPFAIDAYEFLQAQFGTAIS